MNIKDFLLDNYIYIIIVIVLIIITIIGFLADKKRGGNTKNSQNSIPDNGQRAIHSIYYAIYAMPSYIVVVIVAFLIMAAASYA